MAIVYYVRHRFQDPPVLTLDQYHQLKQLWAANPAYNPGNHSNTFFTQFFRKRLWWIVGCLIVFLVTFALHSYLFPEKTNGLQWDRATLGGSMFLAGMIGFFILGQVLLEGPSYATYLSDQQRYFATLARAITGSRDYHSFQTSFYPYVQRNSPDKMLPLATPVIDKLLTRVFCWIDKHFWKVALILLVLFLLNKYVLKISL